LITCSSYIFDTRWKRNGAVRVIEDLQLFTNHILIHGGVRSELISYRIAIIILLMDGIFISELQNHSIVSTARIPREKFGLPLYYLVREIGNVK
jgi:hypothetical protein